MYDVACDGSRETSERELKMPVRWVFLGVKFCCACVEDRGAVGVV